MQAEQKHAETNSGSAGFETLTCPGCRASMLQGMRFCRFCGYRLGEGIAEYAETMRLAGTTYANLPNAATTTYGAPQTHGAMKPMLETTSLEGSPAKPRGWMRMLRCGGIRGSWMTWMIILFVVMSVASGTFFRMIKGGNDRRIVVQNVTRSYFGVNTFKDADRGALIDYVTPPGSPADKAGLVGGDIITSFDGKPVKGRSELMKLLGETPIGKPVSLEFLRDGEIKQTTMTTISKGEMERLKEVFDERPEGRGFFGIDIDRMSELERVHVPELKVHGVRLDDLLTNNPAYIAGLRDGDIVIEFDGIPIRTSEEFVSRFRRAVPDSTVKIVVVRAGQRMEIPLKMGRA